MPRPNLKPHKHQPNEYERERDSSAGDRVYLKNLPRPHSNSSRAYTNTQTLSVNPCSGAPAQSALIIYYYADGLCVYYGTLATRRTPAVIITVIKVWQLKCASASKCCLAHKNFHALASRVLHARARERARRYRKR